MSVLLSRSSFAATSSVVLASSLLAYVALAATPSFVPLALLLSTLLFYSRLSFARPNALPRAVLLVVSLSTADALSLLAPSLHALSTPATSILVLIALSASKTTLALMSIYADTICCMRLSTPWSQITLFPAIWATLWSIVSYVSPVGRLTTWTPVLGTGAYSWMAAWVGPVGIDWVVAAWAVVLSQIIGAWFIGEGPAAEEESLIEAPEVESPRVQPQLSSNSRSVFVLGTFLLVLTIPSFLSAELPLPVYSVDTTPLSVACILPTNRYSKHLAPTLDDYIAESKTARSSASILLWPEGAVRFDNPGDRDAALARIRKEVPGPYIGVSFEELEHDPNDDSGRVALRRNGLALVSHRSPAPHLTYYKRHLVPVAESFPLTPSADPPTIYTIDLPPPKGTTKPEWTPNPPYTRPISLTASICLDFSSPTVFADLDSRPALILAPARTWHTSVGTAMWEQAKARAEEVGSAVLWCDGGAGGVSGVAGRGINEVTQVGLGTWIRSVGIPWPFNDRRTTYAVYGAYLSLSVVWALLAGGWFVERFVLRAVHSGNRLALPAFRGIWHRFLKWNEQRRIARREAVRGTEAQDLLG